LGHLNRVSTAVAPLCQQLLQALEGSLTLPLEYSLKVNLQKVAATITNDDR
jgi:hypothetical protein